MAQCPSCKSQVEPGWTRCEHCGHDLTRGVLQGAQAAPQAEVTEELRAPRGVMTIGWIEEALGGLGIGFGLAGLVLFALIGGAVGGLMGAAVAVVVTLVPVGIGLVSFYLGLALREGKTWAWKLNVAFLTIFFVGGVAETAFGNFQTLTLGYGFPVALWFAVLYGVMDLYLVLPSTRRYFREASK